MSEDSLLPGLIFLAAGLVVGLLVALRMRQAGSDRSAGKKLDDLKLKQADLEARRDEIYERLRSEDLLEADRDRLEESAARTLRDLDHVVAELGSRAAAPKAGKGKRMKKEPSQTPAPTTSFKHPLLVGFTFGAGMVALVGVLIYWALRDAAPRQDMNAPMAQQQSASTADTGQPEMPPRLRAKLEELQARLQADPNDFAAMKEAAHLLLQSNRLMDAFQLTQPLLQARPSDPDGLYIQGFVRLAMGQRELAMDLLDRALGTDPNYVDAHLLKGLIYLRSEDREGAMRAWEEGLAAAGGSHAGLEHLLLGLREGRSEEEILSVGGGRSSPPPSSPPADPTTVYQVRIELDSAAGSSPQGTLFVSLRGSAPGPPAAVKRISNPTFPLDISLSQGDSMIGAALPDEGTLMVRLDSDGNASTRSDDDLSAEATAAIGSVTTLVLK